jgi:ferredoxin
MTSDAEERGLARIKIDRGVCSGHARCVAIAPALFDIDDDGLAGALRQPRTHLELEDATRAAGGCPEQAITIVEAG